MLSIYPIDILVTQICQRYTSPGLDFAAVVITDFGSGLALVGVVVVASVLLWRRGQVFSAKIAFSSLVAYPVNLILKLIFQRARPSISMVRVLGPDMGYSFPSGHAMVSVAVYGILIYLFLQRYKGSGRMAFMLGVTILIILIGLSRIYLGVHWLTDVLGGWMVGLCILLVLIKIHKKVLTRKN